MDYERRQAKFAANLGSGLAARFQTPRHWAEHRRLGNAVEILEMVGTPAARRLLADLAKGDRGARLTRDARLALDRLGKRP